MSASPFGGDLARIDESLDVLSCIDVDEGFVGAGLFGTFVADDADVVGEWSPR